MHLPLPLELVRLGGVAPRSSISSRDPPPYIAASMKTEGRFFRGFRLGGNRVILPFLFRWNLKNQSVVSFFSFFLFSRWMCVLVFFYFKRRFRRLIKKKGENFARRLDEFSFRPFREARCNPKLVFELRYRISIPRFEWSNVKRLRKGRARMARFF